jgi:hypothetical protein
MMERVFVLDQTARTRVPLRSNVFFLMRGFQPLLHGHLLELLGASTQLAFCSKSPCSIAISSWPYLQDAISSSPPLQLSWKVVRTRSEHNSQSAHTLHYVRTHPGTIAERNLISAKLARLCGDSWPHWVQTEKAEIPSCMFLFKICVCILGLKSENHEIWQIDCRGCWQGVVICDFESICWQMIRKMLLIDLRTLSIWLHGVSP